MDRNDSATETRRTPDSTGDESTKGSEERRPPEAASPIAWAALGALVFLIIWKVFFSGRIHDQGESKRPKKNVLAIVVQYAIGFLILKSCVLALIALGSWLVSIAKF